ncbi:hypothetical protein SELMODRAFT_117846 [Selaginella moellendorffii]|uniref:Pentacotripeptide-repeat region of PRORP domain-containing protein n=2 Tax=Selaginella moellendorffii TaxID=88036 RepID=D8SJ20_SELML|nr:hypothetical protein SELMODRAFT_117846 [Selaginella moellendorffii]
MIQAHGIAREALEARELFDRAPERDVISWNTMINAYGLSDRGELGLELFRLMDLDGSARPDVTTFVSVVEAIASAAAIAQARIIHALVVESGLDTDVIVATALINMYGRCGRVGRAREIFQAMLLHDGREVVDVISWNAMIASCASNGHWIEALELFLAMQLDGRNPEAVTFVNVLNCCSHSGLQEDGYRHFGSMIQDYHLTPGVFHFVILVDCLGRTGRLDEAEELMETMPFQPNVVVLTTLLGACKNHKDVKRAKRIARKLVAMEEQSECPAVPYVLLSNAQADDLDQSIPEICQTIQDQDAEEEDAQEP